MKTKYRVIRILESRKYLYKAQIWRAWWPFWVNLTRDAFYTAEAAEKEARLHYGVVVKELDMSQEEQDKFK